MAMDAAMLEALIKTAVPDAVIRIDDVRGDGEYYAAEIKSPQFAGKTRIQQHQMVYAVLHQYLGKELHALQLSTSAG